MSVLAMVVGWNLCVQSSYVSEYQFVGGNSEMVASFIPSVCGFPEHLVDHCVIQDAGQDGPFF